MNLKQLGILLVLVVVLGGAGAIILKNQKQARSAGNVGIGRKLLEKLPVNQVTHVRISEGTNELNLVRRDDVWRVAERSNYPANFAQLSEFMLKLPELKAVQAEEAGASQLARLQLVPGSNTNAPTVVEFRGSGDKELGRLLLGKMHMSARRGGSQFGGMDGSWPDGRYVAVGTEPKTVALVSETFEQVQAEPGSWLNKDFFRVEKPKSIAVTFPEATNSWKLTRASEEAQWELADAKPEEKLDSSKSSGVTHPFASPSFNDVLSGDQVSSGETKPIALNIDTFDGFSYSVKVGSQTNDAYPLVVSVEANLPTQRDAKSDEKPEDKARLDKEFQDELERFKTKLKAEQAYSGWTYLVSTWAVEPLLKPRSELLESKSEAGEGESETNGANGNEGQPTL